MITKTNTASRFGLGCSAASLALGIAFAGAPAYAQNAPAAEADDAAVIVVTGTRIPQPNLTGTAPVTVVGAQEIGQMGVTRTEDLINSLPQAFGDQGGNLANGATGTATINLRNIGAERTLVLINGRRLMPGDPTSSAADINFIPASLVKRVEVLTGGASSTYGSDAVAGVVNFIMDTDFEGFQIDGQYSLYQHNNNSKLLNNAHSLRGFPQPKGSITDGGTIDLTLSFGGKFGDDDQGHFMAYAGYRKLKAVTQDRRDFSSCASQARTPAQITANPADRLRCGGSATSPNGTFFDWNSNTLQVGANRTFIPGFTAYNFAPRNYFQRPDERYTAGVFADYEINEHFHPYMEAMFMDDRTVAQIAESGNFGNTLSVNCDNPLLSPQQLAQICVPGNLVTRVLDNGFPVVDAGVAPLVFRDPTTGAAYNRAFLQALRRNVEGGPRRDDLQHTSFRIVGGMKGEINKAFSYDMSYMFGRTNFQETYFNEFSARKLNLAIDVVRHPTTGLPVCRAALSGVDTNCVPYDMFALNSVTPGALGYVQANGFQRGNTQERVFNANVTGVLGEYGVKTPWADQGLGINIGFEYRKESLELNTSESFATGDLTGQGAATLPTAGSFDVKEVFGEFQLPIVQEGVVYNLSLEGGYRYSHYNTGVNTDTYKLALEFAPVKDITLRASYNRAVRAPNVQDLFAPIRVALNGNSDPCADGSATAAQCALTGLPVGNYPVAGNPAGQYNGLIGGNPNLSPEKSDTKTIGLVFTPTFLPGFNMTLDGFDIKVKNLISQYGQDVTIQQCITTGDPTFCSLIRRDATGSLWRSAGGFVIDTDLNVGSLRTKGIDVGVSYSRRIGSSSLSFNLQGTYLDSFKTNDGISAPYDCAGYYGLVCGTPAPKWRHKARLSYAMENGLTMSVAWRYFGDVKIDRSSSNATLTGAFSPVNAKLAAQSYFDLSASFDITDNYTFRLGVQNILDNDPPIIGANGASAVVNACTAVLCSGNTFPNVYDTMGRYLYAGVTLKF